MDVEPGVCFFAEDGHVALSAGWEDEFGVWEEVGEGLGFVDGGREEGGGEVGAVA